jgi:plasmid stabilization system protein ParE
VIYRFLSPAQRDLAEAVAYYEQATPGLGIEFLDEIERTVNRILLQPEAWTRVSDHHRRCRTRRFPFGLIYAIDQKVILIVAVMNLRRHPDSWKNRI